MQNQTMREKSFEDVFRASIDGLGIFKDGVFFDCNQAMLDMVGLKTKEEFIGHTPFDFSPEFQPDGRLSSEKGQAYIDRCMKEGSIRFEWLHAKLTGETFWVEVIITRMVMNGEQVVHVNWRDISEKKSLELEIAAQKDTFETLFNESVDGLCLLTSKHYLDCNKAFLSMLGFSEKEEIIGLTPMDISPEFQSDGRPSADAAREIIDTAFSKGSIRFEWIHKKKDGSEFWCEIIVFKITLGGEVVLYAITRDIAEKKRLELEIAAQKDTFETLFNESVDGLCLLTSKHYLDCNKAFLSMLGFSRKEEIIGLTPMDISPELQSDGRASADAAKEIIDTAFSRGSIRFEWLHKKKDGSEFWCEIIVFKITLNGELVLYAITRDIEEKKKLEFEIFQRNAELESTIQNLKQTQDKLVESEKMASLGSLVAGVAHEINTPVGIGLTGVTQLMEECVEIGERYKSGALTATDFEDFIAIANEISELVKNNLVRTAQLVRSFKQVAVDQTSEEDREVNLAVYINEVIASLSSVTRKAHVTVTSDCPDNINVITNPGLISQVLTNLIVNSVKHGFSEQDSGEISLSLRELTATSFELDYRDNGKGISRENLSKIFEPFFTTQRGSGGTGLGLNITYNIITNALKGSVVCESEPGQGVRFLIQFKVSDRIA